MCVKPGPFSSFTLVSQRDSDKPISKEELLASVQPQHTEDEIANYNFSRDKCLSKLVQTFCTATERDEGREKSRCSEDKSSSTQTTLKTGTRRLWITSFPLSQ